MWEALIYGFVLAFGLILPLGVQNIFIFSQGAAHPKLRHALPAIVTASICDTLLILLAVAGVSLVVLTISWLKISCSFSVPYSCCTWACRFGAVVPSCLPLVKPDLQRVNKLYSRSRYPCLILTRLWTRSGLLGQALFVLKDWRKVSLSRLPSAYPGYGSSGLAGRDASSGDWIRAEKN